MILGLSSIKMTLTFEEEGVYCFANVGLSVGRSVCPSVDQMVSANYLGIHSPQGSHILCGEWSW